MFKAETGGILLSSLVLLSPLTVGVDKTDISSILTWASPTLFPQPVLLLSKGSLHSWPWSTQKWSRDLSSHSISHLQLRSFWGYSILKDSDSPVLYISLIPQLILIFIIPKPTIPFTITTCPRRFTPEPETWQSKNRYLRGNSTLAISPAWRITNDQGASRRMGRDSMTLQRCGDLSLLFVLLLCVRKRRGRGREQISRCLSTEMNHFPLVSAIAVRDSFCCHLIRYHGRFVENCVLILVEGCETTLPSGLNWHATGRQKFPRRTV